MNNPLRFFILTALLVSVTVTQTACSLWQEPEGPAEQIGKGVDMINGGLQQYDKDARKNDDGSNNFDRRAKDQFGAYKDDFYKPSGDDYPRNPDDFDSRRDQQYNEQNYKKSDPAAAAAADGTGDDYRKKEQTDGAARDDRRY